MKNIALYQSEKYKSDEYQNVCDGIYKSNGLYQISLSFEQEPKFNEGDDPQHISQYPLEDVLDKYNVFISDRYEALNRKSKKTCYLEFASSNLEDVKGLKKMINRHVYDQPVKKNGEIYMHLIVE